MRSILFITIIGAFISAGAALNGCNKKDGHTGTKPLVFVVPEGFPEPVYTFEGNPLTEEGFALGKKLFYDGQLSKDGNFPCASCHQQFAAFATFDHDLSHGFDNQFTTRNAPGLFNLVWLKEMHADGGINHIEVQPLAPITASNEMAEDINNVVSKLKADASYKPLFKAAFGTDEITSQRMLKALAQFMGMMVSADSKYDQVKKGLKSFTAAEQGGYAIFQAKCASCHKEPLFSDNTYRNNGMIINSFLQDIGRMRITGDKADSLKFRVPSLRNVMLTFPYMHDGRFYTLDQVLEHYADGIVPSATLDPLLRNGIALAQGERTNLKAFLATLTDSAFVANKRFAATQ